MMGLLPMVPTMIDAAAKLLGVAHHRRSHAGDRRYVALQVAGRAHDAREVTGSNIERRGCSVLDDAKAAGSRCGLDVSLLSQAESRRRQPSKNNGDQRPPTHAAKRTTWPPALRLFSSFIIKGSV